MLKDSYIRQITAVDETVVEVQGKPCITVYSFGSKEGELVELTKTNKEDFKSLLKNYPSLMRHAKRKSKKLWDL